MKPGKKQTFRKVRKGLFKISCILIPAIFILASLYLLAGLGSKRIEVSYRVNVIRPESGFLDITMTIRPPVRPYLTLYMRDVKQAEGIRVEELMVNRGDKKLLHWQTIPFNHDLVNVWSGFSRKPLTVTYRVNPTWIKGRNPKSFLGSSFAYLRGMIFLNTPVSLKDLWRMVSGRGIGLEQSGQASMLFNLPTDWNLVSPWINGINDAEIAVIRNVYFGAGPLSIITRRIGCSTIKVGVYKGLKGVEKERLLSAIPELFQTMRESTGLDPVSLLPCWAITILPAEPIGGGSSGINCLTTSNKLSVISHEMFHWWNGSTIDTVPDANWIKEGFTSYYEGKMLYEAGIWMQPEYRDHLAKIPVKLWGKGKPGPVNLVRASRSLVRKFEAEISNQVYFGGALVAAYLDRELTTMGKSLDDIWHPLSRQPQPVTNPVFLKCLARLGGDQLADRCRSLITGALSLAEALE